MIEAGWWSQPFAPEGSVAAEGIVKQLGRPEMDPLTVLIREAAQNSWDARCATGPIDFRVSLYRLGSLAEVWREEMLPPPPHASGNELNEMLNEDTIMLVVSDRNTVGLGGPIRAGTRPAPGEKADFVQFMRNVGEARDHEFGGGTYGFGKGIFYRISRAGAILVDTRTGGAVSSRRLMGAALGESYYVGDQRYTGRHWWGVVGDLVADPVLDADAEGMSHKLGLPGFAEGETGTDVVIIAADLGTKSNDPESPQRSLEEAAKYLASSILWHLWPKFVPDRNDQFMRFKVTADGLDVEVPLPESISDLAPFVQALNEIRAGGGVHYNRTVAPKDAGSLSLKLMPSKASDTITTADLARPFTGAPHHVARMRAPELVVDYFQGPPHSDARLAYGAVFKASPEADAAFAMSEPPTHDNWVARGLTGTDKGVVQNVTRFLNREVSHIVAPQVATRGDTSRGLGELSVRLGALIPSELRGWTATAGGDAAGAGEQSGRARGSGGVADKTGQRRSVRQPRIVGVPRLEIHRGEPRVVAEVEVPACDSVRKLRAGVDVVVEGGRVEDAPPEGAAVPTIVEWRGSDETQMVEGPILTIEPGGPTRWFVHASYVDDAVVRFRLAEIQVGGARHAQ